jgi:F-type H+-transporting ATPase subunit b
MEGLLEFITPMNMLLYALNFILLFFVARHFLYKPVTKFIDARKAKIAEEREEIDKGHKEIDDIRRSQHQDYQALIAKGEVEANARLNRADDDAKGIIAAAEVEAGRIVDNAKISAEEETAKARAALREEIASLSVQLSSQILEREVKAEDHALLIDEFLDKVGD